MFNHFFRYIKKTVFLHQSKTELFNFFQFFNKHKHLLHFLFINKVDFFFISLIKSYSYEYLYLILKKIIQSHSSFFFFSNNKKDLDVKSNLLLDKNNFFSIYNISDRLSFYYQYKINYQSFFNIFYFFDKSFFEYIKNINFFYFYFSFLFKKINNINLNILKKNDSNVFLNK